MKITINHNGFTFADILRADGMVVMVRKEEIIKRLKENSIKTIPDLFQEIIVSKNLNDAERMCVFYLVNRWMEDNLKIVVVND